MPQIQTVYLSDSPRPEAYFGQEDVDAQANPAAVDTAPELVDLFWAEGIDLEALFGIAED